MNDEWFLLCSYLFEEPDPDGGRAEVSAEVAVEDAAAAAAGHCLEDLTATAWGGGRSTRTISW